MEYIKRYLGYEPHGTHGTLGPKQKLGYGPHGTLGPLKKSIAF